MRLIALTTLTMVAFAANSLLNRAALLDGETGPAAFAAVRLLSGALFLALLVSARHGFPKLAAPGRLVGFGALTVYILGFSFAYVALDAGVGALLLFGTVQVTMFAAATLGGERPAPVRWLGSALALAGLAWMVWPAGTVLLPMGAALLMGAAGVGWGVYSIVGRGAQNPLGETTANFILASPIAGVAWLVWPDQISFSGTVLAVVSGALTSGLGYALWYSVLPRLSPTVAALSQLTVPVIAVAGGVLFLSEDVTLRLVLASVMVLGGVAVGILGQRSRGSKGS